MLGPTLALESDLPTLTVTSGVLVIGGRVPCRGAAHPATRPRPGAGHGGSKAYPGGNARVNAPHMTRIPDQPCGRVGRRADFRMAGRFWLSSA